MPNKTLPQAESSTSRVFMTGIQALVRLPMLQRQLDASRNLNTAGLISGYRGSPLGAYDQQLWKAAEKLAAHDVVFQPGLNEDLAATALWGAQTHSVFGETRVDGVFGIWYGKGPGVDRTGDAFRNANTFGTSKLGGVLAISGDDHAAQSSMFPHQTDGIFQSASIPILQPASVKEVLELGLAGIELSRFSGLWVALKTIAEVVETAATVELGPLPTFAVPTDFPVPAHGLNWDPRLSWPAQRAELERRLIQERLPAARAWAKANKLDRIVVAAPERRLGIVTVGKAHQDLMQALHDLHLCERELKQMGVSIYKVAMSWPLETDGALAFADGHQELLVIEEKRGYVETQIKDALFHRPIDQRPRVTGKTNDRGAPLLPEVSEFSPRLVAKAVLDRMETAGIDVAQLRKQYAQDAVPAPARSSAVIPIRQPFFCSGCPHNTSTKTPDGSISGGGIGCHVLALSQPELKTKAVSHMGAEGMPWIGAAPFSKTKHVFQNLGDGTYQHSGLLAIRAAVAAKANITYKILYNDAVAMTGGQPAEGAIDPARITRQLHAEGVVRIVLVTDDVVRWKGDPDLATGVSVHHRDELDSVQRELREISGVSAIVYEQTCAAEKRRRRKRREFPDPDRRLFINHRVCEGCGDCSVQSNCISIEPLETPFGRKRAINQSACNKDFSCVKGFCPSFVEIDGPRIRKPDGRRIEALEKELGGSLREPSTAALAEPFNVYVTGIGGSGVLTIGALLGVAAHVDGLASTVLDFTGMSQKNGAVVSQVRIGATDADLHASRIGDGKVDLLLGADLVVTAGADSLARLSPARSAAVLNLAETPTSAVVRQRDAAIPGALLHDRIQQQCRQSVFHAFDASALADRLFGDTLPLHTLMLGYAWQNGLIPLSRASIERAIELNGAAIDLNKRAFLWGRIAAAKPNELDRVVDSTLPAKPAPATLEELVEQSARDLTDYQDAKYARRYQELVGKVRAASRAANIEGDELALAAARQAYRLMAYKDEYEVARLYSSDDFKAALSAQFSDIKKMSLWLAPPLLARTDPQTGRPQKRKFGPWILPTLRTLARFRRLRGTRMDPFGYTEERRGERRLIAEYFDDMESLCAQLSTCDYSAALALANLPSEIRGFGPVKAAAMQAHTVRRQEVLQQLAAKSARQLTRPLKTRGVQE